KCITPLEPRVSLEGSWDPGARKRGLFSPALQLPGSKTNEVHFSQLVMADAVVVETMKNYNIAFERIDPSISRYPYCIVWTPIPVLSWLFPFIGHMGICTSTGVIRDFAGPYFVSEDNMAFGRPTKYWMLDASKVYGGGSNVWDTAVHNASEEYKQRMHNLCCDNCHSHVAMALNLMHYDNSTSWNMLCGLHEDLASLLHHHQHHSSCCSVFESAMTKVGSSG
ncbi:hypothetical protein DNTS_026795, partial [Danionella cerebrum]